MWKKYPGFDYIEVSDEGRIRRIREISIKGWKVGVLILKPYLNKDGYQRIRWTTNQKRYERLLHRMVLETFVGPCPKGYETRHLDNNKLNNQLSNIRWGTHQENWEDNLKAGIGTKLKSTDIPMIRQMISQGYRLEKIAEHYNVHRATIQSIKTGKTWKDF